MEAIIGSCAAACRLLTVPARVAQPGLLTSARGLSARSASTAPRRSGRLGDGEGSPPNFNWHQTDSMAARVYDALHATGSLSGFHAARYMPPSSGHKFLNPDVAKALDILEEALEDGRPLPPIIITPLLRRLSRHRDPAHMVRAFHLMLAAGHAPHPPHYALGLICFGMAAHAPGLHLVTRLLAEYPGRIPAPLYSRLVAAQLACGQYDRALRLLGSMRTMAGLTASTSTLAGSVAPVSDLGPVLWAALDCIANMFPSFPRGTDSLAERHEKADTASTRGRAAAEVLVKHYAIAVVPSAGEANALLGFLCHDSISSPYTNFADDERHRRFEASMLWHRDFGLNPKRTVTVDPASIAVLPPPLAPQRKTGKNGPVAPPAAAEEAAVGAEAAGPPSAAKNEANDWNDRWTTDGAPESSSGAGEDTGISAAVRRRWLAGSPSDHAAWMELLAHALCCKQVSAGFASCACYHAEPLSLTPPFAPADSGCRGEQRAEPLPGRPRGAYGPHGPAHAARAAQE